MRPTIRRGPAGRARWATLVATAAGVGAAAWLLVAGAQADSPTSGGADPESIMRSNNRGAALMEQYKHAQAMEEFRKVREKAPAWAPGQINFGLAALYSRETAAAKPAFLEAIRLDPGLPQGHYGLGLVLKNEGLTAEAIAAFEKARALDPEDADIQYNLGLLHARQRNFAPAIGFLTRARGLDPNSISVRYQLARALVQSGRNAEGEREMAVYRKLSANPRFAVPTGNQYGEAGRYALVITDYAALGGPRQEAAPVAVRFSDVTPASGVLFRHAGPGGEPGRPAAPKDGGPGARAARYGSGLAVGDIDGDGRPDLVFANASADGKAGPALYRNKGDFGFEDVTRASGIAFGGIGMAAILGDFDNDGDDDLYLTRLGGGTLFQNDGHGRFSDVTRAAGAAVEGFVLGASWADVDHDGDLDLFLNRLPDPGKTGAAAPVLFLNRGDGTFQRGALRMTTPGGTRAGTIGSVFADFDADRDIDAVLSSYGGPDVLLDNRREEGLVARGREAGLAAKGSGRGAAAGDVDGDGLPDLIFASGPGGAPRLYLNSAHRTFTSREIQVHRGASFFGSVLLDADNDGDLDLFLAGTTLLLERNDGKGTFTDVSSDAGLTLVPVKDARGVAAADLDGDGDLDLVVTQNGGPPLLLRNEGGHRNRWLEVRGRGLNSNKDGIGARVEVLSGPLWQRREVQAGAGYLSQSPAVAHFGLAGRVVADVVRLLWPGGVLQAEMDVPAGRTLEVTELDRKGSSCPLLFAWNGSRYRFVTDMLGVGGLGLWTAPGVYGTPSPEEYVKIEPDQLAPRDGAFVLQVLENLEEVTYLDEAELVVLDHPQTIDVFPLGAFGGQKRQPYRPLAIEKAARILPVRATDHNDRDVTGSILAIDRTYPDDFRLDRLAGFAEMHHLTLEFPESVTRLARPVLFLYGWVDFEYSSSNYAASQRGLRLQPPVLELEDKKDGIFRPLLDPMGFPPGMPRMISVDLSDQAPLASRRLRLRTNMRLFWDQAFIAEPLGERAAAEKVKVTEIPLTGAHLHHRGYPREHSPDGRQPRIYDYSIVDGTQPFKVMTGDYTRLGRVTELLTRTDDRFVIFGKGEEVSLEFSAKDLPQIAKGSTRSFFLHANGYCKDMDPHTAFPDTVEPLPFHAMTAYPYPAGESYPDDAEHRDYRKNWNTRRLEGR